MSVARVTRVSTVVATAMLLGVTTLRAQAPQPEPRPGVAPGTVIGAETTVVGGAGVIKPVGQGAPTAPVGDDALANDYPTVARADYVFACMQVNGQTRDILEKCSCSVDVIASLLPYAVYEEAETIMSIRLRGGKAMGIWEYGGSREIVKNLKRAQIEGELRCF